MNSFLKEELNSYNETCFYMNFCLCVAKATNVKYFCLLPPEIWQFIYLEPNPSKIRQCYIIVNF